MERNVRGLARQCGRLGAARARRRPVLVGFLLLAPVLLALASLHAGRALAQPGSYPVSFVPRDTYANYGADSPDATAEIIAIKFDLDTGTFQAVTLDVNINQVTPLMPDIVDAADHDAVIIRQSLNETHTRVAVDAATNRITGLANVYTGEKQPVPPAILASSESPVDSPLEGQLALQPPAGPVPSVPQVSGTSTLPSPQGVTFASGVETPVPRLVAAPSTTPLPLGAGGGGGPSGDGSPSGGPGPPLGPINAGPAGPGGPSGGPSGGPPDGGPTGPSGGPPPGPGGPPPPGSGGPPGGPPPKPPGPGQSGGAGPSGLPPPGPTVLGASPFGSPVATSLPTPGAGGSVVQTPAPPNTGGGGGGIDTPTPTPPVATPTPSSSAVLITTDRLGVPVIVGRNMVPGEYASTKLTVRNGGPETFQYSMGMQNPVGSMIADTGYLLQLEVQRDTDGAVIYRGPMGAGTGPLGNLAPGQQVPLNVRVWLPANADDSYQGCRTRGTSASPARR